MNKLWKLLQSRIRRAENKDSSKIPFLHEAIDLDAFPIQSYEEWKGNANHTLIQQRLRQAFFNYQVSERSEDKAFEFFTSSSSNGFAIFQQESYTLTVWDYRFLQLDIASKLRELGYVLKLSDVRSKSKLNGVEQIFRYYLKPSVKLKEGKRAVQLFGNVSLEVILRDDKPYMFKCLANSYNDQHFHPARPFDELVNLLVK